jgi:hypothetical protein
VSPIEEGGVRSSRLARFTKAKDADRVLLVTLRLRLPERNWFGPFTRLHPHALIEILRIGEVSRDVSVIDLWISGQPPGAWGKEIAEFPGVVSVDALAEVGRGTLYRITMENPPIVSLYRHLGLPLPLPLRMQGGFVRWEVVARGRVLYEILDFGHKSGLQPQVISIRRRPLHDHLPLLSAAQQTLLNQAMDAGYFAVPRGITLTALAWKLGRSKSGISESIALIEKKLLESALGSRGLLSQSGPSEAER